MNDTTSTSRIKNMTKDELASIAYSSVENLEWLEMNDGIRLGYHIYLYLMGTITSIEEAVLESNSRTSLSHTQLISFIKERLSAAGIEAL
ncbi:MAG: hypothetical protein IPP08_03145 [Chlorobiota bacterium]|jgi:hypothetical protein|nr:hypothetical protein [Chlorobiota bacterium]QQS67183.1 MAG: hypothetical protein IPP08_03145 [Chlorobiota bacterium]